VSSTKKEPKGTAGYSEVRPPILGGGIADMPNQVAERERGKIAHEKLRKEHRGQNIQSTIKRGRDTEDPRPEKKPAVDMKGKLRKGKKA